MLRTNKSDSMQNARPSAPHTLQTWCKTEYCIWTRGFIRRRQQSAADVENTPQRAAARSTVALAMTKCVCMGYPLFGEIAHLGAALEQSLRLSKFKYIDDAFLLACVLFEGATVQFEPWFSHQELGEVRARV